MNYEEFCAILNRHIFQGEKKELLRKIAARPERFVGLFRPTKPGTKVLQHLLQSHEIRFGDAIEEIVGEILKDVGFMALPKSVTNEQGEELFLDQYFTDGKTYYFIEQKVRDDHDSTKKRGQTSNFETKLEALSKQHRDNLVGIMFFIDPDLLKNKNYYLEELKKFEQFYGVTLHLFYGRELFEFLGYPRVWDDVLSWLERWKRSLPDLPEINFDRNPHQSFSEIKDLEVRCWRKILENDKLWEESIMRAIFRDGSTLRLLAEFFETQESTSYKNLSLLLKQKLAKYYTPS